MASLQALLTGVYPSDANIMHTACLPNADNEIGPVLSRACQRGFDFTLLFEQAVLSIGPSALLLLLVPFRLWALYGQEKKTTPNYTRASKILTTNVYAVLELSVLVLWILEPSQSRTKATIPAAILALAAAFLICFLSYIEHIRSVRPSGIIALYSFFSLILDMFQARTLYLRHESTALVATFATGVGLRIVLMILESLSKKTYLKESCQNLSPAELSGIFNTSFLWWINPLILLGYKRLLKSEDLPIIDTNLSAQLNRDKLEITWAERSKPEGKYALVWATFKAYKWHVAVGWPFRLAMIALSYSQPFIISRTIRFVTEPVTEASRDVGIQLVVFATVVYIGMALVTMQYNINNSRLSTIARGGMAALVHRRALTLQDGVYDESQAVTLMGNDADMVAATVFMSWDFGACIVELIAGLYFLARQVGWACIMPLLLVAIAYKSSKTFGATVGAKSKAWSQATQKRIAMTSSVLGSVKSLKMMGLSNIIESDIQAQRVHEIEVGKDFRWMIVWFNLAANSVGILGPVAVFGTFTIIALWKGEERLSTNKAFTSLALVGMVSSPATRLLAMFPNVGIGMAAYGRLQKFLLDPSREDKRIGSARTDISINGQEYSDEPILKSNGLANGHGNGNGNGAVHILDEPISTLAVSIKGATIKPATTAEPALVDISLDIEKGGICLVAGPVGCGKSTLSRAILGELPLETGEIETSSKVIAYCAQSAFLSNGTIQSNICGPIDTEKIDEKWYETVIQCCGLERDLSLLADGDQSLIGSRGIVLSGGQKQRVALARAVYARAPIILLDDVLSALDAKTERMVVEKLMGPKGLFRKHGTTVILITHSIEYFHLADHIVVIGADKKIAEQGTFEHLRSQEGYISKLLVKDEEEKKHHHEEEEEHRMTTKKSLRDPAAEAAADLTRKTGDTAVYGYWLRSIGWRLGGSFLLGNLLYAFFLTFPQFWLKWWTDDEEGHMVMYMLGYFLLSGGALIMNAILIWEILILIGPRSGRALHEGLLHTVMRATQEFFGTTDTGITLNRFSQDMQMVDRTLPMAGMLVSMQGFKIIAQAILLFSVQVLMLISIPPFMLLVYIIQKIYLQTSRQLRFMDLEAKAPVYSHFLETLEGLSTIRAFGWEAQASKDNIAKLEFAMQPSFLLSVIQRWLNLVLDLVVAGLAILVVWLAVSFRGTTTGGQIGIALNVVLSFNSVLLRLAEGYTQLETGLGAIARLKTFNETTLPEDKPGEDQVPPADWPQKGEIEFRAVNASYGPDALALRNLSMTIHAGQKIGICGRTGSGKSSLLSTLLRLLDLDSGAIFIDGVDLSTLPRETIRTRMIAIPQDPFILSESVRINADPSHLIADEIIIAALEKVGLWTVIEPRGGLEENMKKQPLSVGQQQLFCLARAMLRTSKILVLDEATSNVDRETDLLMQRIIREEFAGHTIVTVAHRLDTILDSDVVAVLDAGALVELGPPGELLEREGSAFKALHGR